MVDISTLLKESRRLAKQVLKEPWKPDMRIAVLGTTVSLQYFVMVLRYLLLQRNIKAEFYEGEYNGIEMDAFDHSSGFYAFKPDMVILLTHDMELKEFPELLETPDETSRLVRDTIQYYQRIWDEIEDGTSCQILQSNFVIPPEHALGNLETLCGYSKTSFMRMLNQEMAAKAPAFVRIIDADLLASLIGKYHWFDYPSYFLSKMGVRIDYIGEFAELFTRQIAAFRGKTRKCLVLDLDNTLWGGVVGDDGPEGIQLDPNNAVGEAYRHFQRYVRLLKQRGVLLAVCSKNDEDTAKRPFQENENMILKLEDISCFVANWDDKATNIRRIAEELNIGTDSLVFFDDNPAEREIVRRFLPEVHVVDVPDDPALYALQLDRESPFEWVQITKEDLLRNNSYIQNRQRESMAKQFVDYEEYLCALGMQGEAELLRKEEAGRFTQLLNKSNQFNLRTQRYTENEILAMLSTPEYRCIRIKLKDKFSEFGIISCVILKKELDQCFIESWVMSCRVLKRNVEHLMFQKIISEARRMQCGVIKGEYIPTAKNHMVENFYDQLGFQIAEIHEDGKKDYVYDVSRDYEYECHIELLK